MTECEFAKRYPLGTCWDDPFISRLAFNIGYAIAQCGQWNPYGRAWLSSSLRLEWLRFMRWARKVPQKHRCGDRDEVRKRHGLRPFSRAA